MSAEPASRRGLPRPLEALLALAGLALISPLLVAAAIAVAASSRGPILFRQTRVGLGGRSFELLKLRTMYVHPPGRGFTARGDRRVTPVGRFLRRAKIDELPQLLNVLAGDMSLVGPRPEVPAYVDLDDPLWRRVVAERPGLTHPLTLVLHPEEDLLAAVEGDPEEFYRRFFLPYRLHGYLAYQRRRTAWSDLAVLARTATELAFLRRSRQPTPEEIREAAEERRSRGERGSRR